jgi:hypothetical protein
MVTGNEFQGRFIFVFGGSLDEFGKNHRDNGIEIK